MLPVDGEDPDRHLRRGGIDAVAHRLRHRDYGELELRLADRRKAALLPRDEIWLAIAQAEPAALRGLVPGMVISGSGDLPMSAKCQHG